MTEENFDHLETVYINLHFPVTTPTVIANKASNSPFKARSYNSLYEGLSEANQRAIAELVLSVDTSTETVLEQLLFAQVANTSASTEKPLSATQSEFDSYRKQFALSKKEVELQELLFNQVAGNHVANK